MFEIIQFTFNSFDAMKFVKICEFKLFHQKYSNLDQYLKIDMST